MNYTLYMKKNFCEIDAVIRSLELTRKHIEKYIDEKVN